MTVSSVTDDAVAPRLRARAQRRWLEFQLAHLRGDHDFADLLERRARALEERADVLDAQAWQPKVEVPPLLPGERAELAWLLDRRLAERARDELAEQARRARGVEESPHGPAWVQAALDREAETVAAAPVGMRNEILSRSAWTLARLACDGEVTEGQILDALIPAARACGLPGREAHAVVRAALRRRCGRVAA
jgi:hypothetical protein